MALPNSYPKPRLDLTCRGGKLFGEVRFSKRCQVRRSDLTAARARTQLTSLSLKDMTYVCRYCAHVGQRVRLAEMAYPALDLDSLPQVTADLIIKGTKELKVTGAAKVRVTTLGAAEAILREAMLIRRSTKPNLPAMKAGRRRYWTKYEDNEAAQQRVADARRLAAWARGATKRRASLCRVCGRLMLVQRTPDGETSMHQACYTSSPAIKGYLAELRRARGSPKAMRALGELPVAKPATPRAQEILTRQLGWAIRHRLGRQTQQELADEFARTTGKKGSRSLVKQGIDTVMGLLPPPELRVDKSLAKLVHALREADPKRPLAA